MADKFATFAVGLDSPYTDGIVINYGSGNQTFAQPTRALYLSTGGTLVVVMLDGTTLTLVLAAGWHKIRISQITAAGSSSAVGHAFW